MLKSIVAVVVAVVTWFVVATIGNWIPRARFRVTPQSKLTTIHRSNTYGISSCSARQN